MKKKHPFIIALLCVFSLAGMAELFAAPAVTADFYFIINRSKTTSTQLTLTGVANASNVINLTSNVGVFSSPSGNKITYTVNASKKIAGYDLCTISTSAGIKTIGIAVCGIRQTAVGYPPDNEYVYDLRNNLMPMDDFPDNWSVSHDFYEHEGLTRIPLSSGVVLGLSGTSTFNATGKLYVNDVLVKEELGTTANPFMEFRNGSQVGQEIRRIVVDNRYYTFVNKLDWGVSANKKKICSAPSGYILYLFDNYSNSEEYGKFSLSDDKMTLYYESDMSYPDYGMDVQAFGMGTASSPPADITYLAYGVTVGPLHKQVAKNGWAVLETRDMNRGLLRNYSIQYTYYNPVNATPPLQFGTQVPNITGSDQKAVAFNISLDNAFGQVNPGDPGHPGGDGSYDTQVYLVKAVLSQNWGTSSTEPRVTSSPLVLFFMQKALPTWLTKDNYEKDSIRIALEAPTFSVCPEKANSNMSNYAVEVDLEVRTMAYKLIKAENGDLVRDYSIPGFDLTSYSHYSGYYDKGGTAVISNFNDGSHPYHMYKVASEKGDNFPNKNGSANAVLTTASSYGTWLNSTTMAIYVKTEINPQDLWGAEAAGMSTIIIPAQNGEVRIERGICGELQETITCPVASSLLYLQDFGGNSDGDPLFHDPDQPFIGSFFAKSNIESAMEGSTYKYKNYARSYTSNATYPNQGLPYLDEGEYMLTKKTEQHFLSGGGTSTSPMWTQFHTDHTILESNERGYMMQVNGGVEKGTFFDYEISDLCNGATMTFTAWIKNTVVNRAVDDPVDQIFETYDVETGNLLSRYYTGPILNPSNISGTDLTVNDWKQYGFRFTLPVGTDKIRLKILNNGRGSNGNDFAIDDIAIRLCNETRITLTPPSEAVVCQENEIEVKVELVNNNKKYFTWFYNTSNQINDEWLPLSSGEITEDHMTDPVVTLYLNPYNFSVDPVRYPGFPTGYYRFSLGYSPDFLEGNCYVITDPMPYRSTTLGETYLWTGNASDGIWKNENNWLVFDSHGGGTVGVQGYPNFCNDAYIPGNVEFYPEILDQDSCRNIYFLQGGQIRNPQRLGYKRAFVDYNFGVVDAASPVEPRNYTGIQIGYSSAPLNRGQWHTIASPLKKTATGDFGFAGKPHTWQMKFDAERDENSFIKYVNWSDNFNDADIELENTYNGMVLLVGHYLDNYVGLSNHDNIDSVDGVIRLPFYHDPPSAYFRSHPLHEHNSKDGMSYFYTYNYHNLEPIYKDTMYFARKGEDGTRFVFEEDDKTPKMPYTLKVPANDDILVGNPSQNENVLASPVYYNFMGSYVSEADQEFNYYVKNGGVVTPDPGMAATAPRYVEPLKSFVISTNNYNAVNDSVVITFDYSQTKVKQNTSETYSRANSDDAVDEAKKARLASTFLLLEISSKSGASLLTLSFEETSVGSSTLLRMRGSEVPALYAVCPVSGYPNAVQFEGGHVREIIPLGILAFKNNEKLTIRSCNEEMLNVKSLHLVDKKRNKRVNLLKNDTYTFADVKQLANRFEIQVVYYRPLSGNEEFTSALHISSYNSTVQIYSSQSSPITNVEIFDLLGRTIVHDTEINKDFVSYDLQGNNVVIVKAATAGMLPKTEKVVLK